MDGAGVSKAVSWSFQTVANPLRLESWKGRDIEQYPDGRCSGRVLTF
jgi:hypothetical protein